MLLPYRPECDEHGRFNYRLCARLPSPSLTSGSTRMKLLDQRLYCPIHAPCALSLYPIPGWEPFPQAGRSGDVPLALMRPGFTSRSFIRVCILQLAVGYDGLGLGKRARDIPELAFVFWHRFWGRGSGVAELLVVFLFQNNPASALAKICCKFLTLRQHIVCCGILFTLHHSQIICKESWCPNRVTVSWAMVAS